MIRIGFNSWDMLIRILEIAIREHDETGTGGPLVRSTADRALEQYVLEWLLRLYPRQGVQQASMFNPLQFSNSELQPMFESGAQNARNRMKKWQECGIAGQAGCRSAQGGKQGRDAFLDAVTGSRVHRLPCRSQIPGPENHVDNSKRLSASRIEI